VGRYGKHLTGSDVQTNGEGTLDSLDFDEKTREMLGLDDIEEILGQIDEEAQIDTEEMEQQAQAIKAGKEPADIKDPDEVIEEMDAEIDAGGPDDPGNPGADDAGTTGPGNAPPDTDGAPDSGADDSGSQTDGDSQAGGN
jgi:hypothetical protein